MVVARYGTTELIADKYRYCNYIKTSLRSKINYLKDNLPYLEFDWDTYRSDPAPSMANLFMHYYERKFFLQTKKCNLQKASIFSNKFRFIDGLGLPMHIQL